MNNAFFQFELDSPSREITTFATNEGLKRLKKLNFGKTQHQKLYKEKWMKFSEIYRTVWLLLIILMPQFVIIAPICNSCPNL